MKLLLAFVGIVVVGISSGTTHLPTTFQKCTRTTPDFSTCLRTATQNAIHQLTHPFKELGLPTLEPLYVESLSISAGTGAVGLQQNYKDLYIHGYSKPRVDRFDIDFTKKTAILEVYFDTIKFIATYDVNGKILLLPVYGKGPVTMDFFNVTMTNNFTFEEYEKTGLTFWKVVKSTVTATPQLLQSHWENLFNGDKKLGEPINKVVNENWREIYNDVHQGYEDSLAGINQKLFNAVLSRIPITELF